MMNNKLHVAVPTWLDFAHKRLEEAVFTAHDWKSDLPSRTVVLAALAKRSCGRTVSDGYPSSIGDATQGMLRKDFGEVAILEFGEW